MTSKTESAKAHCEGDMELERPASSNCSGSRGSERLGTQVAVAIAAIGTLIAVIIWKSPPRPQAFGFIAGIALFGLMPTILLSVAEQFLPTGGPKKSLRQYLIHIQIMALYFASLTAVGGLSVVIVDYVTSAVGLKPGLFDLRFIDHSSIIGAIITTIIFMFIFDFFFYWYHRALHQNRFLWQHHKFHHMDVNYDALTTYRQNWIEALANLVFIYVPISILFKMNATHIFDMGLVQGSVVGLVTTLIGLNHSNLRIGFGRLSPLWVSFQYHRLHHSILPEHHDCNYVAWFPLWDILFRTYVSPRPGEFPPTGVEGENEIRSVWEAQIFSFREWYKYACAGQGRKRFAGIVRGRRDSF